MTATLYLFAIAPWPGFLGILFLVMLLAMWGLASLATVLLEQRGI
jgi:hypothetical protein